MTKFKVISAVIPFLFFFSCTVDDAVQIDESIDIDVVEQAEADDLDNDIIETDNEADLETEADMEIDADADTDEDNAVFICEKGEGIYAVTGSDSFGNYTGTVQISAGKFIRLITYSNLKFEEKTAALVFEGSWSGNSDLDVSFSLKPIGFIEKAGDLTRDGIDTAPIEFTGKLSFNGCNKYSGKMEGSNKDGDYEFNDVWTWIDYTDGTPIWKNERTEIPNGPEPSETTKATLEQTFASFLELPDVAKYSDKEEFKKFVHLMVVDKTDYDFYQQNKDVIRVIQKIPDTISLAEAWMRNNAYSSKMSDKELFFDTDIADIMINELGMISHKKGEVYEQDGDSLLWTGVYVAALSMKYMITNDSATLDKMLKSLNGIITCLDITPDPAADFARTLRVRIDDGDPEFHAGTGTKTCNGIPYNQIEYKENGNNDMSKGPKIAFLWAYQVLKDKPEHKTTIIAMAEALKRMRENHPVFKDSRTNQASSDLILAVLMTPLGTGYLDDRLKYLAEGNGMFSVIKEYYDSDLLLTNQYGVSDWSGNHLTVWGIYNDLITYRLLGNTDNEDFMKSVMTKAGDMLKYNRTGLFQLMTGTSGSLFDTDSVEDALWRMREIPLERAKFFVNWEINPDYCVSPLPELFWKNDWTTSNRKQSIRAYPVFEKSGTNYFWKDNILNGNIGGGGGERSSGLDFYIAYWFGRFNNVISFDE
ncbi:MAG TPA: hypothetical protein PKG52_05840 [bacterium]|nr:hypothetical protein [bacterium]HPS30171.1 hypothetical protein [bacterium]